MNSFNSRFRAPHMFGVMPHSDFYSFMERMFANTVDGSTVWQQIDMAPDIADNGMAYKTSFEDHEVVLALGDRVPYVRATKIQQDGSKVIRAIVHSTQPVDYDVRAKLLGAATALCIVVPETIHN